MNPTFRTLLIVVLAMNAVGLAQATELGINYYHESMMSDAWKVPYINDLTLSQAEKDFDDISTISSHVKLYMNPFVDGNDQWVAQLAQRAKDRGLYVVVNMMTDDRNLEPWNWDSYAQKVRDDCSYLNGKVDEILVGNEIILHSSMSKYEVRNRVEPLISECKARFNGKVSYEAFWYEKEAWYDYPGQLYFMQYESVSSFTTNVKEMAQRFGSNGLVGEFGEDLYDESTFRDDWWQKESIEARWSEMEKAGVPIAYLFAYREPSWNGFGLIRPDGIRRPMWSFFESKFDGQSSYTPPAYQEPTPQQPQQPTQEESTASSSELASLSTTCTSDAGCWEKTDEMKGTCREVRFGTNRGDIKILACLKSGEDIEVYTQSKPSNVDFTACVGGGCVEDENGFARSTISAQAPSNDEPTQEQPQSSASTLSQLQASCSATNTNCDVKSDRMDGTCRDITYTTGWGDIRTKACEKEDNRVEAYLLSRPNGLDFEACIGNACLRDEQGFAKTTLSSTNQDESSTSGSLSGMTVSCESGNSNCNVAFDRVDGACRNVHFSTGKGTLKTMACEKDNSRVEVYVTERPSSLDFRACYDDACVRDEQGFATTSLGGSSSSSSDEPTTRKDSVSQLAVSASPDASKKGDWTSGTCRTVQYDTSKGWIEAEACDKGSQFEIYLKTQGAQANLCFENACVGGIKGFATLNK